MKKVILLLVMLLNAEFALAQAAGVISGQVRDGSNENLPGATIQLLNAKDSATVSGTVTDATGKFLFSNVENGEYLLKITALGQRMHLSTRITLSETQPRISLPVIILQSAKSVELKEVLIKAKKPLLEQEIDRTIVNVESMISAATSNTLEVLEKTPGISVSNNGEISLNGKTGVLVLIDGRSTYMSGADLASYLKSLPGGLLEKIELIDNPPAKYDAAGNAVIDIRLKKNRSAGLTGNISVAGSQGKYARSNDAINLNYNTKKLNLFTNLGYGYEKNYSNDFFNRKFYNEVGGLNSVVDLTNTQIYQNKSLNANLGFDFAATPKTTFGMILNLNRTNKNGRLDYFTKNYNANAMLEATGTGNNAGGEIRNNTGLNFNLLHKFDKPGRELSADVNYLHYDAKADQILQNQVFEPNGNLLSGNKFLYVLPADIHIYTAKADYGQPLKNNAKMEAGFKSSLIRTDNVFNYYVYENEVRTIDQAQSNHFKYRENINAVYLNGQKSWKQFGVQLGLRVENTNIEGMQLGNEVVAGSSFSKHYTGVFPSAYVSFKPGANADHTLGLMAVRRISRPNYQLLNPFLFQRDSYTYSSGNSDLDPQYQSRIELKYQRKQWLNMGLSYNRFTNSIFPTTQTLDTIFLNKPDNIAGGFMVLLNTTVSQSLSKWWYTNATLRLSRVGLKGNVLTENLDFQSNIARFELNNYFTLGKTYSAELGGYYASRDFTGQTVTSGMYRVNAAIQKKIWNGKGSIRLAFDDIFHSWVYLNKSISLKQAEYLQTNQTDTQRVGAAFTYRFGKDAFARKRRHSNNASDEEKERL